MAGSRNSENQRRRKRIGDARSPEAKAAGLKNVTFDTWGNIISGTDVITGQRYEPQGPVPTNIDRLRSGELTKNLEKFKASQSPAWQGTWEDTVNAGLNREMAKRTAFDGRSTDRNRTPFERMSASVARARANQRFNEIRGGVPGTAAVSQAAQRAMAPEGRGTMQTAQTPWGRVGVRFDAPASQRPVPTGSPVVPPAVTEFSGTTRPAIPTAPASRSAFNPPAVTSAPAPTVAPPAGSAASQSARFAEADRTARQMFGGLNEPAIPKVVAGAKAVGREVKKAAEGTGNVLRGAFRGFRKWQKRGLIRTY